jgi:CheY-like chemotaxis protein
VTDRLSRPPAFNPLVAIFNSRDEVIETVRSALENEGFSTVTARLAEIQSGTLDLVAFVEAHDPHVIVYDIPRPYENHWNFLRLLKETSSLKAAPGSSPPPTRKRWSLRWGPWAS